MAENRHFPQLARRLLSIRQVRQSDAPTTQGSGNETMTNTANSFRNAFVAVAFAFCASAMLVLGTVSAPLV
jgi:uncharacterized membrane protein YqgA involved in biofilm formation